MIRKAAFYQIFNTIMFGGGPILVSLASFGAFTFQGYSLTASVAFPALALFNLLRFPVMMFPNQIMNIIAAKVALDRIQNYMQVTNASLSASPSSSLSASLQHPGSHDFPPPAVVFPRPRPICILIRAFPICAFLMCNSICNPSCISAALCCIRTQGNTASPGIIALQVLPCLFIWNVKVQSIALAPRQHMQNMCRVLGSTCRT